MGFKKTAHNRDKDEAKKEGGEFSAGGGGDEVYYVKFGALWEPDPDRNTPEALIAKGQIGSMYIDLWNNMESKYYKDGSPQYRITANHRTKNKETGKDDDTALGFANLFDASERQKKDNEYLIAVGAFKPGWKILVSKNRFKEKDKHPDYIIELFQNKTENRRKMDEKKGK